MLRSFNGLARIGLASNGARFHTPFLAQTEFNTAPSIDKRYSHHWQNSYIQAIQEQDIEDRLFIKKALDGDYPLQKEGIDKMCEMAATGLVRFSNNAGRQSYKKVLMLSEEQVENVPLIAKDLKEFTNTDPYGKIECLSLVTKGLELYKKSLGTLARTELSNKSLIKLLDQMLNPSNEEKLGHPLMLNVLHETRIQEISQIIAEEFVEYSSEQEKDEYAERLKIDNIQIKYSPFLAKHLVKLLEAKDKHAISLFTESADHLKESLSLNDNKHTTARTR